jgi:hypothetical protein
VACNFGFWGLAIYVEAVPTFWCSFHTPSSEGMRQKEEVAKYIGLIVGIREGQWHMMLSSGKGLCG